METPIIPKPIKRYKGTLYFSFTWFDLAIISAHIITAIVLWVTMPLGYWPKFGITFLLIFLAVIITVPINDKKLYFTALRALQYIFSKKGYSPKRVDLLIPYRETTEDGMIKLKSGSFIRPIHLTGFNIAILQEQEQLSRISAFREIAKMNGISYSIIKQNLPNNLDNQYAVIDEARSRTKNKRFQSALDMNKAIIDKLSKEELTKADKYFFLIYGDKETIQKAMHRILSYLTTAFLQPRLTVKQESQQILNDFYMISNKQTIKTTLKEKTSFRADHIQMNGKFTRIYAITEFPRWAGIGWMNILNLGSEYSWSTTVEPYDKAKATKKLDKVIRSLAEKSLSAKKASQQTQSDSYMDGLYQLNDLIHADGESLVSTYTFVKINAKTKEEFNRLNSRLVSELKSKGLKYDELKFLQKEAFESILPKSTASTKKITSLELPSIALAYGFPFYSEVHRDVNGLYLGYTPSGNNVFFDIWQRDTNRQNSNGIILGTSGSGKSTISKKLMKDQLLVGRKIIAIDPEREYKKLAKSLDGEWVNFGSDTKGNNENRINPLQFLKNESGDRALLSSHIQFLEQFFRTLFPSLTIVEISVLRKVVVDVYKQNKITSKNSHMKIANDKFPILSDVTKQLRKQIKTTKDAFDKDTLKTLIIYFECFELDSPEAKLWNGYTNFDIHKSHLTIMDTHSLGESGNKRLSNSQMFLLLKIVNNLMVQNKILMDEGKPHTKLMIVIDEAHLMIDERQPAALDFMYQMVKRARKYNALTLITTQNIRDFIGGNEDIKRKTSAIINTSQYAFLLKMNSGDIDDLDGVYSSTGGLTMVEKDTLATAPVGKAILAIGSKDRKIIQVDITDEELALWE